MFPIDGEMECQIYEVSAQQIWVNLNLQGNLPHRCETTPLLVIKPIRTADPMHQNTCLVIFGTATKLRQIAIVITAIGNKWS